jgi:hypothetical protein
MLLACREPLRTAFKLPYLWPDAMYISLAALISVTVALLSGVLAATWPAFKCSLKEPYQEIRRRE